MLLSKVKKRGGLHVKQSAMMLPRFNLCSSVFFFANTKMQIYRIGINVWCVQSLLCFCPNHFFSSFVDKKKAQTKQHVRNVSFFFSMLLLNEEYFLSEKQNIEVFQTEALQNVQLTEATIFKWRKRHLCIPSHPITFTNEIRQ